MATYKVCCVRDCPARDTKDVTFLSLPQNRERRLQWLKLIDRIDLYDDLGYQAVCSIHFDQSEINAPKHAIPTRNIPRKRKGEPIFTSDTASQTDFSTSDDDYYDDETDSDDDKVIYYKRIKPNRKLFLYCESHCDDTNMYQNDVVKESSFALNCSKYIQRDKLDLGNRKIFIFCEGDNAEISKNGNDNTIADETVICDVADNEEENVVPIITNVVSLSKPTNSFKTFENFSQWRHRTTERRKGAKHEKDFKIFALNLHTINTRAYRLLADCWHLPKEKELKELQLKIGPSFDEQMVKLLGQKFKLLSNKEKFCTICLYAVPLKPHLYYDPADDDIIGIHNVNGNKERTAAMYALIASVRGVIIPWHQPVAYSFFSNMAEYENIQLFLKNTFQKLKSMGLKILGVVMGIDQLFWKYCRSQNSVSLMKPYLKLGNDKLYVIFDIPHVMNMFKAEFMDNDYVFENENVSGKYVKQVYDIDKKNGNRLLSSLSDEHIKAGNMEKNPEHTCQVFGNEICGALYFYIEHGLMDVDSTPTAHFIKKVNETCDLLMNITRDRNIDSQMKSVMAQNKAYDDGFGLFKKLFKCVNFEKNNADAIDSVKYFLISLKSLRFMSRDLKEAKQIGIAQSRFCTLKPLLDFIKLIKKDAKTIKPSPIKFMTSFSKLFLKKLIDLTPAPSSIGNMEDFLKMADSVKDCCETYSEDRIRLKENDYRFTLPEVYAIIYVSSYLLYKCSEIHTCNVFLDFMKHLVDLNKTKVYVNFEKYNKEASFYDKLKLPPMELPAYVERLDNYFLTCFSDFFHTNPAKTIFLALKTVPPWKLPCPCFPNEYMLKLFVRTRLYETILYNTKNLRNISGTTPCTLEAKQL